MASRAPSSCKQSSRDQDVSVSVKDQRHGYITYMYVHTYNLLNSSNKRACSNTFVHVTLVSSTHNNGQKLQENVKSDTRKLLKHLKKNNLKMKKTTHTKQEHTHVKYLKRQLMTKDFLWRLKLHVGNWNEWPLVLRT